MTIRRSNNGVSPSLNIAIDGVEFDYRLLQHIELKMDNYQHDLLRLSASGIPSRAITDYIGRPVYCSLSSGPELTEEFYGYVVEVKPSAETRQGIVNGSTPFQGADLFCVGASYIFRNGTNRSWLGYSLPEIVEEISNQYGFTADVPNDTYESILPQLAEKDWPFLVRLCKYNGLRITSHGTNIHVHDPYQAHGRQISVHAVYAVRGTQVNPSPGQIISFEGRFTERKADDRFASKVVTVSYENGETFDVVSSELPINRYDGSAPAFTERIGERASTYEEAVSILNSYVKEVYDYEATASVVGLLGCRPGGLVDLQRYGSQFDGLWYVDGVTHRLNSAGTLVSDLRLLKNVVSEFSRPTDTPRATPPPAPVLTGSRWQTSKKRGVNAY